MRVDLFCVRKLTRRTCDLLYVMSDYMVHLVVENGIIANLRFKREVAEALGTLPETVARVHRRPNRPSAHKPEHTMWLYRKSAMLLPNVRNVRFESDVRDSTLQSETSHNYKKTLWKVRSPYPGSVCKDCAYSYHARQRMLRKRQCSASGG